MVWIQVIVLAIGIVLTGAGFLFENKMRSLRIIGMPLVGCYWLLQVPYFLGEQDLVNAAFSGLGLPLFGYIAYADLQDMKEELELEGPRFMSGLVFYSSGPYFLVYYIPILSGVIIYLVAHNSVGLLSLFGHSYSLGSIDYGASKWFLSDPSHFVSIPIIPTRLDIVLSCTALQSMMIFAGAVLAVKAPWNRKKIGFLLTVPVIYFLNLIRNAGVIYMEDVMGLSHNVAHHTIGKGWSLVALIILAFILFRHLPEVSDALNGVMDMHKIVFSRQKQH